MIASMFVALLAGHYAGDFLVQTDHQANHKALPWREDVVDETGTKTGAKRWTGAARGLAGHLGGYFGCQAVALALVAAVEGGVPLLATVIALSVSIATHGFIDRRWPVVWWGEHTGSAAFVAEDNPVHGRMLVDQAMHFAAMFLAAVIASAVV